MTVRRYKPSDCKLITELFYDTVHTVNAADYTKEQLNAWAPEDIDFEEWSRSLSAHYTIVAEGNGLITGFGDIDKTGYLDRLYVHKDYQGRGIGTAICSELERSVSVTEIHVHVSVTAKAFFEKRGYIAVKKQQAVRRGVYLTNYVMIKRTDAACKQNQ